MLVTLFAVFAYLVGMAGAGLFFAYVVGTGTGLWPRPSEAETLPSIQINCFVLALFAFQHSGMARETFKQRLGYLSRSIYVATSGITLGILAWFWQAIPGEPIWHGPVWVAAISIAAALFIGACCGWFDHATFMGLTQAWTGTVEVVAPLRIEGPYRYVRHPLMLGLLIVLWAQPIMPPELLMLNIGMTVYILFGIMMEETDLVRAYGEEYERYRNDVPALIPWIAYR
ncbi:MAG: isoprenylcysteine carboxylmethyltransferase family protein [Planctomycetes bacterium]|nr:isoprenylcysteine carboxylmethyltransferase family protein [Planctomycetota bacterium]